MNLAIAFARFLLSEVSLERRLLTSVRKRDLFKVAVYICHADDGGLSSRSGVSSNLFKAEVDNIQGDVESIHEFLRGEIEAEGTLGDGGEVLK